MHAHAFAWQVFFDMVRAYFREGRLPLGRNSAVAARVPTGVGEFMLGLGQDGALTRAVQTEAAYTLYVNPPYPFNRGVGDNAGAGAGSSAGRPAFVRSVSVTYPPGLLFPSSPHSSTGDGNGNRNGKSVANSTSSLLPPEQTAQPSTMLQEFSFQSGLQTTRPVQPLHILSCAQCGLAVCGPADYALNVLPSVYLTTSGTLVLPNDLPGVNYSSAVDVDDCNLLHGPGVAFVTGSAGAGIVAVPATYRTQSLVYSVPQQDGRVMLYAQATGEVFAATADFKSVEMRGPRGAERHLWTLAPHPTSKGGSVVSTVDGQGNTVAWQAAVGEAPVMCAQGASASAGDCLYAIRLAPTKLSSLLSAFEFQDA